MSLIFIGYVVYNSKQQSEYQAYLNEVQAQEQALAEAEAAAQPTTESTSVTETAEAVIDQATAMYGEQLVAAKAAAEQSVVMKNDYLTVDFTTRGAKMQKVVLAEYTKYAPKDERTEKIVLFDPETAQFDMEFYIKRGLNNVKVNTSEYVFNSEGVRREGDRQVLTMSLEVAPGAKLKYEYVLYDEKNPSRDYLIDFNIKMENLSPIMAQQSSLGLMWSNRTFQNERSYKTENMYTTLSYRLPGEDDVEDLGMSESSVDEQLQSEINWVAFRQQYFSQAFIAHGNFAYADMSFTTEEAGSGYLKHYTSRMGLNYTPQQSEYNFSIYCGPNKYAVLSDVVGPDGESIAMERLIPLGGWLVGWFNRWIVIPVFDLLRNYIGSFGVIILILAVLIRLLIMPLTYKSYVSMAKMRLIKPEMDALAAKYPKKEDAMKRQQATMELYKKAGVNPMGGCIPMLIQLPILIAMFRFFPASIELRGESFLWTQDLSSYDSVLNLPFSIPFYGDHVSLFALLMAISTFLYSWVNYQQTASSQPQMAGMKFMMLYMMPLMLLFWFNSYSSGLCFYYLLSNILILGQTYLVRRMVDDNKIRMAMEANAAKRSNGKKSKFQQRYEELMRMQEMQQKANKK